MISNLGVFVKEKERKERSDRANDRRNVVAQHFEPLNTPWCLQNQVHPVTSHFGWFRYVPDPEH